MEAVDEYSNTDILNLFYIHGECGKILSRTCRTFNERYPNLQPITKGKFRRMESCFLNTGSVKVKKNYTKPIVEVEENEVNVLAYFHAYPRSSIVSASGEMGISSMSIHRILKQHRMHPYKETLVQAFRPGDEQKRVAYCEMILLKIQEDENFLSKVIWSDESKFNREGIVNRRNNHFWARENPHICRTTHFQDRYSFNVFCCLLNDTIMYEIYNENLNEQKYLELLRGPVTNFLRTLPPNIRQDCWYQMDGAPAHNTREVYGQLTEMFEDRWFGSNGPWSWPPRSPELTPLDFYLWGKIKSQVYSTPSDNKQDLLNRVRVAFQRLDRNEIGRATTRETEFRIIKCLEQNGGHIEHL